MVPDGGLCVVERASLIQEVCAFQRRHMTHTEGRTTWQRTTPNSDDHCVQRTRRTGLTVTLPWAQVRTQLGRGESRPALYRRKYDSDELISTVG